MLLALLYCGDDNLIAAAPACEQQPYGVRYWFEVYPAPIELTENHEMAYVKIDNRWLCQRLLDMPLNDSFVSGFEAAHAVDEYLGILVSGKV